MRFVFDFPKEERIKEQKQQQQACSWFFFPSCGKNPSRHHKANWHDEVAQECFSSTLCQLLKQLESKRLNL